jgi:hypothetical protein
VFKSIDKTQGGVTTAMWPTESLRDPQLVSSPFMSNATLVSIFRTFDLDKNDRLNSNEFLALVEV